jgi:FkbM family methyltransferase
MLREVDVFINIGANIGYYCSIALQDGKPTVAFEPMENNLRYLYKNLKANDWDQSVEIFPLALSDRVGIADIFGGSTGASLVPGWAGTSTKYVTSIATSTLDTVLGCRFRGKQCFILADVEGAERRMLAGATSFLGQSPKPIWMIEIAVSEHQPNGRKVNPHLLSTFEVMWANGYEALTASRTPRVVSPSEINAVMTTGRDSLETHNVLFIDRRRPIPSLI